MNHVATERRGDHIVCTWIPEWAEVTVEEQQNLALDFSRIALGFNLVAQPTFGVILGERRLEKRSGDIRLYYILDEVEEPRPQDFFRRMIEKKDQYRIATAYGPKEPRQLADSLRHEEGLSWYREEYPRALGQAQWPSYVDYNCKCGINLQEMPDEGSIHRDIEALLGEDAVDPDTGHVVMSKGIAVPRLNLPRDFPVQKIRAAIQRADTGPCAALWFALMGLERSGWIKAGKEPTYERRGNQFTGY